MGRIWTKMPILLLCIALAFRDCNGFGVSKRIFSKKFSPKIQHVPTSPYCKTVAKSSFQAAKYRHDGSKNTRWSSWLNPIPKLRKIAHRFPLSKSARLSNRTLFISAVSVLVALVVRPTLALAMGGGMGGSKGPVAPMQRYVQGHQKYSFIPFPNSTFKINSLLI